MKMKKWAAALLCGLLLMTDPGVAYAMPDSQAAEAPAATAEEGGYDGSDVPAEDADAVRKEAEALLNEKAALGGTVEIGGKITWSIDGDGKLTVEGTGDFSKDAGEERAPWYSYGEQIKTAVVNVQDLKDASYMFCGCQNMTDITLSGLDTSQVTNMSYMFAVCRSLTSLDLSRFNTEKVTDMSGMFEACSSLPKLDLSSFETREVTGMFMMFCGCESLADLDLHHFHTGKVTNMGYMFAECKKLETLNVTGFDTGNVENMRRMFLSCHQLPELDLNSFDTHSVTDGSSMFEDCKSLKKLDLSHFDTGNVTNMELMFSGCSSLTELNVAHFNTGSVTNMGSMFSDCSSLKELNVAGFDTGNVAGFLSMFAGCSSLETLDVSNFDFKENTLINNMFLNCSSLKELDLGECDFSGILFAGDVFTGCDSLSRIRTPLHVSVSIPLPVASDTDAWYNEKGKKLTELPQKLAYSITIEKNRHPEVNYPYLIAQKTKRNYICGDTLNTDDISVYCYREMGVPEPVTKYQIDDSAIDLSVPGDQELRVTYDNGTDDTGDDMTAVIILKVSPKPGEAQVYKVTFDLNGHGTALSEYASYTDIKSGETIKEPTAPTAEGYTFTGWYKESACENLWNFKVDTVSQDTTLYAGWKTEEKTTFKVTFDMNGHGTALSEYASYTDIKSGETIKEPTAPTAEGYTFTGWYKEQACTNLWNFTADKISQDTTLYAGWKTEEKTTFKVTFDVNGHGTALSEYASYTDIKAGETIKEPTAPTADGYTFTGWYKESACTNLWNFKADTISQDTTLYAGWKQAEEGGKDPEDLGDVLPEDVPENGIIPEGIWVALTGSVSYTGKAVCPEVRVYQNRERLEKRLDYTVKYKNNKKADNEGTPDNKKPMAVVTLKKHFPQSGPLKKPFHITPVDLNEVTIDDITVVQSSRAQKKVPVLIWKGKKLAKNKDFKVSYPDTSAGAYKEKGSYPVVLTGGNSGNFTGTRTVYMAVTDQKLITKASVNKIRPQEYTGSPREPKLEVTYKKEPLTKGTDYDVTWKDNVEIGTATAYVTGKGVYAGVKKVTFKITGVSLKGAKVEGVVQKTYNGALQVQKLTVTARGGKCLTEGTDYKVSYSDCRNAGKATVAITGIRACTGVVQKTFKIAPYDLKQEQDAAVHITGLEPDKVYTAVYASREKCRPDLHLTFNGRRMVEGRDYTVSTKNDRDVTTKETRRKPQMTIKGKGNFKGKVTREFVIKEY